MAGLDAPTTEAADNPGVIARPPLLYLGTLLVGLGLNYLVPVRLGLDTATRYAGGGVLAIAGLALAAVAIGAFRRGGTNVRTSEPALHIITAGPYRFSRNPIYVGGTLLYAGIAVLVDAPWALVLLAPLLVVMRYGVIAREERYLAAKFGDDYRRYKDRVRRWL
jgi:protein-S-isoprenylcysteine O-methyltransferase Ste14